MAEGSFVSYIRVSTARQGVSGLGLDAQRKTVSDFLNGGSWRLVGEFVEVESGKAADRPELANALSLCRVMGATLVVANVSRLTRSVAFLSRLLETSVPVRFCDLPAIEGPTGRFLLTQMAAVAELEAGLISDRTKKALAAAKARGQKLGNPGNLRNRDFGSAKGQAVRIKAANGRAIDLAPIIAEVRKSGAETLREIAAGLNNRGVYTARGKHWSATQIQRVLVRLANKRL
ncbi:recombinase family protein [Methylobacterium sp. E-025]|uniref:recombinase family protein n=1 Tax=Methylobacterium sp. E-025 TaxID=2836561 RepID=UPI001FBA75DB|nr:recombinase family protein [Methylobacterium sp. E-025]MCJ2112241.1 recombinase family protein [Methylobacterium sp. E-025]